MRAVAPSRVIIVSDRFNRETGEVSAPALLNRTGYADAQKRQFIGLKLAHRSAELRGAGYSAAELLSVGLTAKELKEGGFSLQELKALGFGQWQLKSVGFSI